MTYLLTGATGFVGSQLVRAVLERGDAVYYLARKRSEKLPSQASFHPWDTFRKPDLTALSRIDVVINLAGEPVAQRWTPEVKKRIRDSRVAGTQNLVAAIAGLQHKPAVLVSASAIGYYGDRAGEILTESSAPAHDFLASVCQEWEQAALAAEPLGLRVVTPRISIVLGRDGGALPAMAKPFRFGLGGRLGSGKQWMSWIHVDDLVRLFLFAAETPSLSGALNAASPNPVTNAQFTGALAHALHRPAPWMIPEFALKLALGEMSTEILSSKKVIPEAARQAGFEFSYANVEKALSSVL